MNYANLHELINRYEQNIYTFNDAEHNEKFKWQAVQTFRSEWFSPKANTLPFSERFHKAQQDSSVLIDNRIVHPSNGIVKLAEQAQEEVRSLFEDVLFVEDGGDLDVRQNNMDLFVEGFNKLLQRFFPGSFKYQQNRHAASCYLAMYAPEKNFIYKFSSAEAFAQHIEFGKDLGSGSNFRLSHYYELCETVVAALKEHPTLLEKHNALLEDIHYRDKSLHLLAFDIIYCASAYHLLTGLTHKSKKEAIRHFAAEQKRKEEEQERQARIDVLEEKIQKLNEELDVYRTISLVGIQVNDKTFGTGTVTQQNINQIHVSFSDVERDYILSKEFLWHPTFEDDEQLISAMTEYAAKIKEFVCLQKQLDAL